MPDIERALTPARPRPRRPARPRGAARRARRDRGAARPPWRRPAWCRCRTCWRRPSAGSASTACWSSGSAARWPQELPLFARDGGFIARGLLARARPAARVARRQPARDRRACRRATPRRAAIASLRIRHNNVIGYYVEVTAANAEQARRQARRPTSSTARRWPGRSATPPPSWPNSKAGSPAPPSARWRSNCALFDELVGEVMARRAEIAAAAAALAVLDVAASHAELAAEAG